MFRLTINALTSERGSNVFIKCLFASFCYRMRMTQFEDQEIFESLLKIPDATTERLSKWLRTPPKFTVLRINTNTITKQKAMSDLRHFLQEQYEHKPVPVPTISECPTLNDIIILESAGENCELKPVPNLSEVIVGYLCGNSVLRGSDVFAPGVLGAPFSLKVGDEVNVYADVEETCLRGFAKEFLSDYKVFLGIGKAMMSRKDIFNGSDKPSGIAIKMIKATFDCPSLSEITEKGIAVLQNFPSVLCSHVLFRDCDFKLAMKILDMCAAPGGKTCHIGEVLRRNECKNSKVYALDKSKNKIKQLVKNVECFGFENVECFAYDSTKSVGENPNSGPPFKTETFDRILLDAPCSALGQRPQFHIKMKHKEFDSFPKLQKKLFIQAFQLLKPNGILVYSTCSPSLEENEIVCSWALETFPELELITSEPKFGQNGIPCKNFSPEQCEKVQRFSDFHGSEYWNDTIGFFIAKFIKRSC